MAHPDDLLAANFFGAEEGRRLVDVDLHAAVLLRMADAYLAAEALDEELEAVANADDDDAI